MFRYEISLEPIPYFKSRKGWGKRTHATIEKHRQELPTKIKKKLRKAKMPYTEYEWTSPSGRKLLIIEG